MRPGGTVWRLVDRSPWRTRSPSGDSVTVNSQSELTRCQMAWTIRTANHTKMAMPMPGGGPMTVLLPDHGQGGSDGRGAARRHETISRSTDPTSRPWGTVTRRRSGASGAPSPAPADRPSRSARRDWATGRAR